MTCFRLFKRALILPALFVFNHAAADKGVFNAKISPNEFFTNTPTSVTLSAEIGAENFQLSSITAYQSTREGELISKLAQLVDDGTQGDERAADTIFTGQFTVNKPKPQAMYVRIMANYKYDRHNYLSPVLTINTYDPLSTETLQRFENQLKAIKTTFLQRLTQMPIQDAREQAYIDAKHNLMIQEAKLNGVFLSILFKKGVRGSVTLDGYNTPIDGLKNSTPALPPNRLNSLNSAKVLIFAPGYSDTSPQNEIADYAKERFNESDYLLFDHQRATITKDANASLDLITQWGHYNAVILHTHGGVWSVDHTSDVILQTGTSTAEPLTPQNSIDLSTGRIGIKGVGKFVIFPSFISRYAATMKNTFFYLGACNSLSNDSLWQALKAKGAKLAFGWSDTVARGFNAHKFKELLKPMLPTKATSELTTAKAAYDAITDKTDGWCLLNAACIGGTGATLTLKTTTAAASNHTFFDEGLINGSFESGDWTGWQHGGDSNFRLVSGAIKHQGNAAAALGAWDTTLQGHQAQTMQTNGSEWFYQDFVVPQTITHLKFYWWMETYNTFNGDGFDVTIKDTNGKTLKILLNPVGTLHGDGRAYWTTPGWQEVKTDISAYRGRKIRLYFEHRLTGLGHQQRVYVDDVSLEL